MVSPRIGFVYDVKGEGKDIIRGSWGLFRDQQINQLAQINWVNNCPDCFPVLPFLLGCALGLPGCSATTQLTAGTVVLPNAPPMPNDFTLNNWVNDPSLRAWLEDLTSALGPLTLPQPPFAALNSPDWETPYTSSYSFGWGHSFSQNLVLDTNLVYRRGFHQMRAESFAGLNSGRESPFPAFTDPNGVATYPGNLRILTSDGKSEYVSLQLSFQGRYPKFDFTANLNLSEALGTQDSGSTAFFTADPGKTIDILDGGNIQFTGGSVDSEWGRMSGDQSIYAFLFGIYRFPHNFRASAQIAYGSRVAIHPFSGEDLNGDGHTSSEYGGSRGGSLGDEFFNINCRISKLFDTGKGTSLEIYMDVFNLLDNDNTSTFLIHRQFVNVGGQIRPNPAFLGPIGTTLTPPRTVQLGTRFTF